MDNKKIIASIRGTNNQSLSLLATNRLVLTKGFDEHVLEVHGTELNLVGSKGPVSFWDLYGAASILALFFFLSLMGEGYSFSQILDTGFDDAPIIMLIFITTIITALIRLPYRLQRKKVECIVLDSGTKKYRFFPTDNPSNFLGAVQNARRKVGQYTDISLGLTDEENDPDILPTRPDYQPSNDDSSSIGVTLETQATSKAKSDLRDKEKSSRLKVVLRKIYFRVPIAFDDLFDTLTNTINHGFKISSEQSKYRLRNIRKSPDTFSFRQIIPFGLKKYLNIHFYCYRLDSTHSILRMKIHYVNVWPALITSLVLMIIPVIGPIILGLTLLTIPFALPFLLNHLRGILRSIFIPFVENEMGGELMKPNEIIFSDGTSITLAGDKEESTLKQSRIINMGYSSRVVKASVIMLVLSLLLFWLPLLGPFIAGYFGGKTARSVGSAILAVLLPIVIISMIFALMAGSIASMPLIGAVAGGGIMILIMAHSAPLTLGALLGGTLGA